MTDLQLLYKAIRNFFDETPVEEWSYPHFLKSFEPVIMANIDVIKVEEKGIWRKRFITRLEKIIDDDAYSKQQRDTAKRLKEKNLSYVDTFWDNIERKKECLRRRQEVENKMDSVRNNTEVDALDLLETARAEKTKRILNSLKRKPEDIVNTKKRCKLPGNDSEYYGCSDSGESESESKSINEEIKGLSQDEANIHKKLLEILTLQQKKDKESGKNCISSIPINNIIDLSNNEVSKQVHKILDEVQIKWLGKVLQRKLWKQMGEFLQYINQFTEDLCDRINIPILVRESFVPKRTFNPYLHEAHDIAQQILTHFSVRLEAPLRIESKNLDLERTYSIDTTVYILNRLFRMQQDIVDIGWIELTTPDTKKHKIDGLFKVIKTAQKN
ncbi:hypothetical protein Glove_186g105 [Diversispora epigaea]|uniref:Uncharacterized protein n=1 Tax=Diversispora epigaea TaxID=1348612 RepID=A0A397IWH7_9GLOM|nr:hypothetical protein Glove_186g105 [Diversispora epigaea]